MAKSRGRGVKQTVAKGKAKPEAAPKSAKGKKKGSTSDSLKATEEESRQGQVFWAGYKQLCDVNKKTFEHPTHVEYMKQLSQANSEKNKKQKTEHQSGMPGNTPVATVSATESSPGDVEDVQPSEDASVPIEAALEKVMVAELGPSVSDLVLEPHQDDSGGQAGKPCHSAPEDATIPGMSLSSGDHQDLWHPAEQAASDMKEIAAVGVSNADDACVAEPGVQRPDEPMSSSTSTYSEKDILALTRKDIEDMGETLTNLLDEMRKHALFGQYMDYMKVELAEEFDTWTFGDVSGDAVEDAVDFKHWVAAYRVLSCGGKLPSHQDLAEKITHLEKTDAMSIKPFPPDSRHHVSDDEKDSDFAQDTLSQEGLGEQRLEDFASGFPSPPSSDQPDINNILVNAAKIMVKRAAASKIIDMQEFVRSLPRCFPVGDYFTGAATFAKVTDAIALALLDEFPSEAKGFEVKHEFMAEWVPFKQKFILASTCKYENCCVFADALRVLGEDRECVRHDALGCDLPDMIRIFNGGFSCRSFSKLHPDYQPLLRAMAEANQGASSVVTFDSCVKAIGFWEPDIFLLENVEMRMRLYFGGYSRRKQPNASFSTVEQLLSLFKMKSQPPAFAFAIQQLFSQRLS